MSMSHVSSRAARSRGFVPSGLALAMLTLLATVPQHPAQAAASSTTARRRTRCRRARRDNGSIALPKKKDKPEDTPPPAPAAPKFKNPEGAGNYRCGWMFRK